MDSVILETPQIPVRCIYCNNLPYYLNPLQIIINHGFIFFNKDFFLATTASAFVIRVPKPTNMYLLREASHLML